MLFDLWRTADKHVLKRARKIYLILFKFQLVKMGSQDIKEVFWSAWTYIALCRLHPLHGTVNAL